MDLVDTFLESILCNQSSSKKKHAQASLLCSKCLTEKVPKDIEVFGQGLLESISKLESRLKDFRQHVEEFMTHPLPNPELRGNSNNGRSLTTGELYFRQNHIEPRMFSNIYINIYYCIF